MDGQVLPADRVVLAMGPWTGLARQWLPQAPPISGHLCHSIVIQAADSAALSAHCLFVNHRSRSGDCFLLQCSLGTAAQARRIHAIV